MPQPTTTSAAAPATMSSTPIYDDQKYHSDNESGYASADSSQNSLPDVFFSKPHLRFLNQQLAKLSPEDILRWCLITLPSLYQETAFGLSGLVTVDMLSRMTAAPAPAAATTTTSPDTSASAILSTSPSSPPSSSSSTTSSTTAPFAPVPLIFLDTLHQFPETHALISRVRARYPSTPLHTFQPENATSASSFAALHGDKLWETDEERYDWLAKVSVAQRAYATLGVKAVLTGRRRTQGGSRGQLDVVEVTEGGMVKVNPLANWSFKEVRAYVDAHDVPYNELLDRGYTSVGDWHSTQPTRAGEDERAGRWRGREKTECGIHNPRSKYAVFLEKERAKETERRLAEGFERGVVVA